MPSYIFSHACFRDAPAIVRDFRRSLVEDRLDKLPLESFVKDARVQVDSPVRADRDLIFIVTEVDQENGLIYLDDGGYIDTFPVDWDGLP